MPFDDVALERLAQGKVRGRQSGARWIGKDHTRQRTRQVRRDERPAALERELHQRPVERPVPAPAVEVSGVGECFSVGTAGPCGVERRLVLGVELLHRQHPQCAAHGERVERDSLQAVVLRVVVHLAQDHVAGARREAEHLVRRNEGARAHVPNAAGERMVLQQQAVGTTRDERRAGDRREAPHTTRVRTGLPAKWARRLSTCSMPIAKRVSFVALPTCG